MCLELVKMNADNLSPVTFNILSVVHFIFMYQYQKPIKKHRVIFVQFHHLMSTLSQTFQDLLTFFTQLNQKVVYQEKFLILIAE